MDELLERKSEPLPANVVNQSGNSVHMDQKLATLKPTIARGVEIQMRKKEPSWVSDILNKGLWTELVDRSEQQYVHIDVEQFERKKGTFRVAFVLKGVREDAIPDIRVFGSEYENGFQREPLQHRIAWRLRMPDPSGGQRMVLVVALDIELSANNNQILIATECQPLCTMVNAVMIAMRRRSLMVEISGSAIPEPINLLFDDVVNKDVVGHLLRDNIPADTARILSKLPVAYFEISGAAAIQDFEGVWLYPTAVSGEGAMLRINAPDDSGYQRKIRPGKAVTFNWYRRTDGSFGNVPSGAIRY